MINSILTVYKINKCNSPVYFGAWYMKSQPHNLILHHHHQFYFFQVSKKLQMDHRKSLGEEKNLKLQSQKLVGTVQERILDFKMMQPWRVME